MDREILGIDHGNRQMKTANTAFLSTVTQQRVKSSNLNQILEFNGQYYAIGGSMEEVITKIDKTVDDDYYILTLAALATELKSRGKNQAAVRLATGLPPRWYESQMKPFRKYLGREKELNFRYQGEDKKSNDIIISYFYNSNYNKIYRILSYNLVLATGGYGAIFSFNDNHIAATGEGILLAKSTGAKLKGMSTVMYHPWSVLNGKKILVGDIVALSGGKVIDDDGKQLIKDEKLVSAIKNNSYHEMFRDILEKEFEIIKNGKRMYLDLRCLDEEYVKNMLKLHGYTPEILVNGLIQIYPTVHYTSGGVVVDGNCQAVNVPNMYVVGEAQFNGDKGCGRLPGQAFTSAIVCGKIISDAIKATKRISKPELIKEELCIPDLFTEFYSEESSDLSNIKDYLKQLGELLTFLTSEKVSLLDLTSANEEIEKVEDSLAPMKGSGKDFLLILKVHFICGLAREILNDIKSREKTI